MGTKAWILVLAAAAAVFAAGAWLQLRPAPAAVASAPVVGEKAGTIPTRAQVASLQLQAEAACRCARPLNDPWNRDCWAGFQRSLARYDHSGMASACAQESVSLECFGPEGPNRLCVVTGRPYGACNAAEEQTLRARARARGGSGCD